MRKSVKYFLIAVFIIVSLNFISAPHNSSTERHCSIVDESDCSNRQSNRYVVFRLSDDSNAHAELYTEDNYDKVLCCNFGNNNRVCKPPYNKNKVIGISSSTNAHAEIRFQSNYSINICYDNLDCRIENLLVGEECRYIGYEKVFSLSSSDNAHIGTPDVYPHRTVCCDFKNDATNCKLSNAFWNASSVGINNPIIEGEEAYLEVEHTRNSLCPLNQKILFEIFENNTHNETTGSIHSFMGTFGARNSWRTDWIRDEDDKNRDGNNNPEYYFKATVLDRDLSAYKMVPLPNQLLKVVKGDCLNHGANSCSNYANESRCNADPCGASNKSCNSDECKCFWNETITQCGINETTYPYCGDNVKESSEQCDGTDLDGQDCSSQGRPGGTLSCYPKGDTQKCRFDFSGCNPDPSPTPVCGNGQIDEDESCDGGNLGIHTCESLTGFSGTLKCHPKNHLQECQYDITECSFSPPAPKCGDGEVNQPWEECDQEDDTTRGDGCDPIRCKIDNSTNWCGDGIPGNQPWEECDNGSLNGGEGNTCSSGCQNQTLAEWCGDGEVNLPWESCDDGNILHGDGCGAGCLIETSNDICGDGIIQAPNSGGLNEKCDLQDINRVCRDLNSTLYSGGTLKLQ